MFKYNFAGRVGSFLLVSCLASACAVGEIGGATGGARSGPGDDGIGHEADQTPPAPDAAGGARPEPGDDGIGNEAVQTPPAAVLQCPGANPDVSALNGWRSSNASLPADGALRFDFKVRPTAANLNGLVAVGAEKIDGFQKAAIAVRFAENGLVDVRDGAFYSSDMAYPYDPGVWYSVGVSADIDAETYDVEIGPCGEPRQPLIENASFRDNADIRGQLSAWAVWSSKSAALEVSTPAWMASNGCLPATCQSMNQECGQPSDGCGGALSCGTCGSGEMCSSGVCVDEPLTPLPPPACIPATCQSLSVQCGVRVDGCGGYLSCGTCGSGETCSSGVCVDEPVTPPPPPACVPDTCQSLGTECGGASDGCGASLSCGGCGSGKLCSSGVCVAEPVTPPPPPAGDPDRPWAHNTGPSNPGALVPSGPLTLSSPGVYENLDIDGDIYITSSNVTVRNFRVDAAGLQRGVWITPGLSNILLEDGEVFGMSSIGIYGMGYTARRLHIHDSGGDALRPEGNPGAGATLVEYCFIERMGLSPSAHADALQVSNVSEGSYNVTLQYNNFFMPAPGTPGHPGDSSKASAVIFLEKPVTNYVIQNNWLDGGGYTVYCGNNTGGVLWRDNVFGHDYDFGVVTGSCQNWSGNVWEDTGAPVPPN